MSSVKAAAAVATLKAIPDTYDDDETSRMAVQAAVRQLLARLSTPFEQALALAFDHPIIYGVLQTLIDVKLWTSWTTAGDVELTLDELSRMTEPQAEATLLGRFLSLLASNDILIEVEPDKYYPTPFSRALGDRDGSARKIIHGGTLHSIPAGLNILTFLRANKYTAPDSIDNTPFTHMPSNSARLNFFQHLATKPESAEAFTGHMTEVTKRKANWTDTYDTQQLFQGSGKVRWSACSPLIVDMGGGSHGVDIMRMLQKHPDLPAGALVLQDLPEVVDEARPRVDENITMQAHNFFMPQPIVGSKAYFMHCVLHDWPDDAVLNILKHLRPAMIEGYSKLLICDVVLPASGATAFQTAIDLGMMMIVGGLERTEKAWRELLTRAGFLIVKLWPDARGMECVIEAEVTSTIIENGDSSATKSQGLSRVPSDRKDSMEVGIAWDPTADFL